MLFLSAWFPKLSSCLSLEAFLSISFLQEANEAGALRLAKSKLEKQLEDLTLRLQLEKRLRVWLILFVLEWLVWQVFFLIALL